MGIVGVTSIWKGGLKLSALTENSFPRQDFVQIESIDVEDVRSAGSIAGIQAYRIWIQLTFRGMISTRDYFLLGLSPTTQFNWLLGLCAFFLQKKPKKKHSRCSRLTLKRMKSGRPTSWYSALDVYCKTFLWAVENLVKPSAWGNTNHHAKGKPSCFSCLQRFGGLMLDAMGASHHTPT